MSPVRVAPAQVPRARILRLTSNSVDRPSLSVAHPQAVAIPVVRIVRRRPTAA